MAARSWVRSLGLPAANPKLVGLGLLACPFVGLSPVEYTAESQKGPCNVASKTVRFGVLGIRASRNPKPEP